MKNVDMKVEGNILTIEVDLSKEFGPSGSGKTIIMQVLGKHVSDRQINFLTEGLPGG